MRKAVIAEMAKSLRSELIEVELETMQRQDPDRRQTLMDGLSVIFVGGVETIKALFPPAEIPIEVGRKLYAIWQKQNSV